MHPSIYNQLPIVYANTKRIFPINIVNLYKESPCPYTTGMNMTVKYSLLEDIREYLCNLRLYIKVIALKLKADKL